MRAPARWDGVTGMSMGHGRRQAYWTEALPESASPALTLDCRSAGLGAHHGGVDDGLWK